MKFKYLQYVAIGVLAVLIFVVISMLSQEYSETLQNLTDQAGFLGVFSYIGIMIVSIVVAPVSTGFLLPMAANSWGPFWAATYSIIGWTIGAMISFYLAKKYGFRLFKNAKLAQKMRGVEKAVPKHNVFLFVVLLRMALPVDLLSYALGTFSTMGYKLFFWSTVIGITPFAFIFSYASISSVIVQVLVAAFGSIVFLAGTYYVYFYSKTQGSEKKDMR